MVFFFNPPMTCRLLGQLFIIYVGGTPLVTTVSNVFDVLQRLTESTHNWKKSMSKIKVLACMTYESSNKN